MTLSDQISELESENLRLAAVVDNLRSDLAVSKEKIGELEVAYSDMLAWRQKEAVATDVWKRTISTFVRDVIGV